MSTLTRRSPKLAPDYKRDDVRDSVQTLEDRPRVPIKTPASQTADGYDGEVCQDDDYVYFYTDGFKWSRLAKAW